LGIDAAGMSSGLGYPNVYYPSVTIINWSTGQPNARYWTLKLLIENLGPGDRLMETQVNLPYIVAQGYETPDGKRRILLADKRDRPFDIVVPDGKRAQVRSVNQKTKFHPPETRTLETDKLVLQGFEVCILTFPH
jgi:hypothetical protein